MKALQRNAIAFLHSGVLRSGDDPDCTALANASSV